MEIGLFKPNISQVAPSATAGLGDIKFKDAKGKIVNLEELQGKVVFINFWATWCPPCLAEMPSVNKLHEQFKNDQEVVFLMIDADSDFNKAQAYMDKRNYKLPVYTFASELPTTIFKGSLPTTLVFDKKGRISFNEQGAANYSNPKFIAFIKQLKELRN
jgi:thiol-disulfide isomerase/thioredoxin